MARLSVIKYKSKKTNEVVTQTSVSEDGAVGVRYEDGTEKTYSKATIKRWWIEFEEFEEEDIAEDIAEDIPEVVDPPTPKQQEKKKEEKRKEQKQEKQVLLEVDPIKVFVEEMAKENGLEVVKTNVKNHIKLTYKSKAATAFNYSKNGVILMYKQRYVGDFDARVPVVEAKHMFDRRVRIAELTPLMEQVVSDIMSRSKAFMEAEAKEKAKPKTKKKK